MGRNGDQLEGIPHAQPFQRLGSIVRHGRHPDIQDLRDFLVGFSFA
jgi:hypothetical protein